MDRVANGRLNTIAMRIRDVDNKLLELNRLWHSYRRVDKFSADLVEADGRSLQAVRDRLVELWNIEADSLE